MSQISDVSFVDTPRASWAGPAAVCVALVAAVVVFWNGLTSLVGAWSVPEYSHGPIIPLISTFLFLRELRTAPPVDHAIKDRFPGLLIVAFGLLVGVVGALVRIDDITTYGFIIWVAGVILISFGFRRGLVFWPAVVHLVFMLPLPQFVYWKVSIWLQFVSSEIGVWLIQLFSIPVFLDGNVIDLGIYKLQVAEACSGLRYLFPMLSFSYVFAVLYQGPKWHKVLLLLSAAPITVAMNSFRIGMIGVLVNSYGIEQAEGFLHAFEGWIIFTACVGILFLLTITMQRLSGDRRSLSEALDIEFNGLGAQAARIRSVAPSATMMAAAALTVAVAMAWTMTPQREAARVDRDPFVVFPMQLGEWRGKASVLEREIERVLGADDYLSATYAQPDGASVNLFVAFYHSQTEGGGIHSPEVCIPSGGWEVSSWRERIMTPPSGESFAVNRAVIQKGLSRQLVYFWFEQRGRRMTSDYAAKLVTVYDSLRIGRTDGGLVRLITPIGQSETEEQADARLTAFVTDALEALPRFVPQ